MKKKKTTATTTRMAQLETVFPENIDLDDPHLYINRELGMLEFQRRVLDEAVDPANPLLERVKFLAILGSNLEEFFMVRVGGLIMQRDEGVPDLSIDGLTAPEQLVEIRKVVQKLMEEGRELWNKTLMPELDTAGIHIRSHKNLAQRQKQIVNAYFHEMVYPVLTPLAFDPGHPFPHISNLSLNLAVLLEGRDGQTLFARIKVPDTLPQLVPVKRSSGGLRKDGTAPYHHYFVWLSDLISANIDSLFPGLKVLEVHPFHVIRNADMEIQELEASDLLETMEESVRKRRFGVVVRLAIRKDMPDFLKNILVSNLKVDRHDVYTIDSPMVLSTLMQLARIERQKLKDRPFTPTAPVALRFDEESPDDAIYTAIRAGNILL
ncbi:RNA degradosome polyphosphate kinase, partial [bacterium]|nr:RNA degradosome polyphosphate kinase [bacterium]